MLNYTRNGLRRCQITLEPSGEDVPVLTNNHLCHPSPTRQIQFYLKQNSPLVSSVVFTCSPLVSSVVFTFSPPDSSVVFTSLDKKIIIIRCMLLDTSNRCLGNHTPNEWRRYKSTLETSAEDTKRHSKRVEKLHNDTRNEWRR